MMEKNKNSSPKLNWSLCATNQGFKKSDGLLIRSVKKNCLKCYVCPNYNVCKTSRRPRNGKKEGCGPRSSKHGNCSHCKDQVMILEACFWKIEWKETCSSWIGLYSGEHNHNKPPPQVNFLIE